MILRIVGVNHFDPLGRQGLCDWLKQISQNYGRPTFVATEWDKDIFLRVKAQRKRFRRLLRGQWPNISEHLLGILELSLGYEGDSHEEIYPGMDVLWLDEGRDVPVEDAITKYAEDRLTRYRAYMGEGVCGCDDTSTLGKMSKAAALEAGSPPETGPDRDKRFADLILQKVKQSPDGWAVVIVGKDHATAIDGSMACILDGEKLICEVAEVAFL
jgi:hypothetical protein